MLFMYRLYIQTIYMRLAYYPLIHIYTCTPTHTRTRYVCSFSAANQTICY